jgi:hypothetical protein
MRMRVIANLLGSTRVPRVGERAPAITNFSLIFVTKDVATPRESLFRRDAATSTRDACATQNR